MFDYELLVMLMNCFLIDNSLLYEIFSFIGIDLHVFFLYLCLVGTLLACYSVPRQVDDECENETWKSRF